jgi:hypothetical protein
MFNEMSTASLLEEMRKAGGEQFTHETMTHAGGVWHSEIAGGQYVFPEGIAGLLRIVATDRQLLGEAPYRERSTKANFDARPLQFPLHLRNMRV